MVRSLYSGVAGLKTQQTKMDVIGNNIANVGTYGYKSSRATFQDVYYQTSTNATAATGNTGGTNAMQIGYGDSVSSIDVNTSTSAMSSTGYNLDVAIAGEGYLQVMDASGKIFYTKAGMLDIDAEGNLVDINGNFVLGVSGSSTQPASSNKIQINLPYLEKSTSKVDETINGKNFTLSSGNATDKANVSMTITSSNTLPIGQKVAAKVSNSAIVVTLNANETFKSIDEFNEEVNKAITAANGGVEHAAGAFTLEMDDPTAIEGLTGAEIASTDFSYVPGEITLSPELKSYFAVKSVNEGFSGNTAADMDIALDDENNLTVTIGNYKGTVSADQLSSSGTLLMTKGAGADSKDSFVISYPSLATLKTSLNLTAGGNVQGAQQVEMTASAPSKSLGLGTSAFRLTGGTEGGEQSAVNLTSISIGDDGVITGTHEAYGIVEIGRIDLATFANPAGLAKVGNTYFETTLNSGDPVLAAPGTESTGQLVASTLESSNVDLSSEMTDMIMSQRGFQASSRIITVSDSMLEELINLKR